MPDKTDFDRAIELYDRLVAMRKERDKWREFASRRDCRDKSVQIMDEDCGKCLPCLARTEIKAERGEG